MTWREMDTDGRGEGGNEIQSKEEGNCAYEALQPRFIYFCFILLTSYDFFVVVLSRFCLRTHCL